MKKVISEGWSAVKRLGAIHEIVLRAMYEKSLTAEEAIEMIRKILA